MRVVSLIARDHPRLRGEYSEGLEDGKETSGSPPLARGVPIRTTFFDEVNGITPACAGSTTFGDQRKSKGKDHPRLRGEYLSHSPPPLPLLGSPPLARGVPSISHPYSGISGITPACAGSTIIRRLRSGARRDHPRLRGEYNLAAIPSILFRGSPPLARGVLWKVRTRG